MCVEELRARALRTSHFLSTSITVAPRVVLPSLRVELCITSSPEESDSSEAPPSLEPDPPERVTIRWGRAGREVWSHVEEAPHSPDPPVRVRVRWGRVVREVLRFRQHLTDSLLLQVRRWLEFGRFTPVHLSASKSPRRSSVRPNS